MKIRRIEIENFRKLVDPVVIEGFDDGVTVVCGDNEEGKSTVLQAIQTAFFVRHRVGGEFAGQIAPYGHDVRPVIAIDFEIGDGAYRLRKAFRQRPEAKLITPTGDLTGDAVEEELQRLLSYAQPGRETGRMENRGLLGLFWVQQGTTFQGLATDDQARQSLMGSVEGEVETVLGGGRGRTLLRRIGERRGILQTPTGRPRGPYAEALGEVDETRSAVAALESRLADYEADIDRLGDIEEKLRRHEADRTLATAQARFAAAQTKQADLDRLRQAVADERKNVALAQSELDAPSQRLARRTKDAAGLQTLEKARETKGADRDQAVQRLGSLDAAASQARQALDTAQAELAAGEERLRRAEARHRRRAAAERKSELEKRIEDARKVQAERGTAEAAIRANPVDADSIRKLRSLDGTRLEAASRAATVATQVGLRPDSGRSAQRDGAVLDTAEPFDLAEPATLSLDGWGEIDIRPGGDGLEAARAAADAAIGALNAALREAGVGSMDEAERAHRKRGQDQAEVERHTAVLDVRAPEGIEALEAAFRDAEATLANLPEDADAGDGSEEDVEALRVVVEEMRDALRTADAASEARRTERDAAKGEADRLATELAGLDEQIGRDRAALAEDREAESDDALKERIADLGRRLAEARNALAAQETALDGLDATAIDLELESAEKAVGSVRRDIEGLKEKRLAARARLEALGSDGLGEQLEQARAAAGTAEADAERYRREADALDLLEKTLRAAEAEAKDRFLAPVRERVTPYLKLVFPEARLAFDAESLELTGIERDGVEEPYEGLSLGTREQVAVLARLAFAELVAERGDPALVILDDALVYADEGRLERMLLAIRQAARRVQVIVLTCRERDYAGLGAPLIRLEACTVPG